MLGNPKYNYGDKVYFTADGNRYDGVIAIIDKYGTFFNDSDVSYDIYIPDINLLWKHIREPIILGKTGTLDSMYCSRAGVWNYIDDCSKQLLNNSNN